MKQPGEVRPDEILTLLRGKLSKEGATQLRNRIREDASARALYDRLAAAETALDPGALEARVKARVFEDLAPTPRTSRRSSFAWLAGLAAAAAALVFVLSPETPTQGGYARRGAPTLDGDHVLQVLRARIDTDEGVIIEPATSVRPGDPLRFAVASRVRDARVSVLAVQGEARTLLGDAAEVPSDPRMRRLDVSFRAPEDLRDDLRIVAVFAHGEAEPNLDGLDLEPRDGPEVSIRAIVLGLEPNP